MARHNPKTSPALIYRFERKNPRNCEIVARVFGEREALKQLEKFRAEEKEPHKFAIFWKWKRTKDAHDYEMEKLK